MGKMIKFTTVALMVLLSYGAIGNQAQADETPSATLYLSPSSTTVKQGDTLTVDMRENSGDDKINAADIYLSYPFDRVEIVSVINSSAFNLVLKNKYDGGLIRLTAAAFDPPSKKTHVTGDQSIATITFKALASSGTADFRFEKESVLTSPGYSKNALKSSSGGNYVLTSPAPLPLATKPAPPKSTPKREPAPTVIASANNERVTLSVTTPNTERRKEQNQVGFWVPLLVLVGTMLVSTMAASGFSMKGIRRHFMFLLPSDNKHKYPHL